MAIPQVFVFNNNVQSSFMKAGGSGKEFFPKTQEFQKMGKRVEPQPQILLKFSATSTEKSIDIGGS